MILIIRLRWQQWKSVVVFEFLLILLNCTCAIWNVMLVHAVNILYRPWCMSPAYASSVCSNYSYTDAQIQYLVFGWQSIAIAVILTFFSVILHLYYTLFPPRSLFLFPRVSRSRSLSAYLSLFSTLALFFAFHRSFVSFSVIFPLIHIAFCHSLSLLLSCRWHSACIILSMQMASEAELRHMNTKKILVRYISNGVWAESMSDEIHMTQMTQIDVRDVIYIWCCTILCAFEWPKR